MNALVSLNNLKFYDAAIAAIAQVHDFDEVEEIENKAEAVRAYARQARNLDLEIQATEIRLRARRRLGQILNQIMADSSESLSISQWKRRFNQHYGVHHSLSCIAFKAASPADNQYENLIQSWRSRCRDAGRAGMALEVEPPEAPRYQPQYEPPPAPSVFDDYSLASIPVNRQYLYADQAIGDVHVEHLDGLVANLIEEAEDIAAEYAESIRLLRVIRRHFGGGFSPNRDGSPVLLREVISEPKLEEFIAKAKGAASRAKRAA